MMKCSSRRVQQGTSLKWGLKHEAPHLSLETTRDNFLTHQRKEHDSVVGAGGEQKSCVLLADNALPR